MKIPKTHGQLRQLLRRVDKEIDWAVWHVMKQRNAWRDVALAQAKEIRKLRALG